MRKWGKAAILQQVQVQISCRGQANTAVNEKRNKPHTVPNTLCHIALQAPITRLVFPAADLRLIALGCIIPDLPWIWQRLFIAASLTDIYPVQLYCLAQASLFCCCLLAAALALLTNRPGANFLLLAGNCLAHLLLDATQIKWANGIHLAAPFDWQLLRFDLSWPEHGIWKILTAGGLLYLLSQWRKITRQPLPWRRPGLARAGMAFVLLALYGLTPLAFRLDIASQDTAFLRTLHEQSARPGKYVEFDRLPYNADTGSLRLPSGELLLLAGQLPAVSGLLSVQGHFQSPTDVAVLHLRQHSQFRDYASLLGLFLIGLLFLQSLLLTRRQAAILSTET